MIKKISLLLGLAAAIPASSFAWVGGPFDGGDYSQMLDDRGIYQAALRMENGSGVMQFGVNVDLGPSISTGSDNAVSTSIGSYTNRSLIYYKGVMFFGNASGFVDHKGRSVTGYTNAQSEVSLGTTSSSSTGGSTSTTSAQTTIVSNGLGLTANATFTAKITSTFPELRFEGQGEMTVINPSAQQVMYAAIVGLINNYSPDSETSLGNQINDVLSAQAGLTGSVPSADSIYDNSDRVKLRVYGQRKFFLSRR